MSEAESGFSSAGDDDHSDRGLCTNFLTSAQNANFLK